MQDRIIVAFRDAEQALRSFAENDNVHKMDEIAKMIANCFAGNRKVLICGNGGSNCDACHFAEEFTGRFRKNRAPLPVIAISDSSHITCVANDYGFSEIFARGVAAYGGKGDILIAISTSGKSENVIKAVQQAQKKNMKTIGLLGKDGGKMKNICDHVLIVDAQTTDRIQEVHMTILHILIEMTERLLFPENYD